MTRRLRVLIIEDSEADSKLLVHELRRHYQPVEFERVETRQSMVAALEAGQWDVIVSDWSLPSFSALGALEVTNQRSLDIPFMIVSGVVGEEAAVEAMRAGADDYFVKGRLTRLAAAIDRDTRERERRRALLEDQKQGKALARSLEAESSRLMQAIQQADEAAVISDATGSIVYVNPAFEKHSGYSRDEVLGRNPRFLKSGQHDDAFYRTLWETISSGRVWRGRLVNRTKGGSLYTLEGTIAPVRNPEGVITNYVAVRHNITSTLAMEAQFLQAQKMEAVGRLAGGVAHDFNNILTVILSYADLLMGDPEVNAHLREDLEEIQKAGNRAAALTRQLLAFSRQQVLQPQVLNLNDSCLGIEKMIQRLVGEDVELTVVTSATGLVKCDPGHIEQVLMNLVVNARDAMPTGGRLKIETADVEFDEAFVRVHEGAKLGPHVALTVTDSGVGMDAATQARVFEPFFTTKELGRGTGLGLSTVYGIVKQSGGSITLSSELGIGTAFRILLPTTSEVREEKAPGSSRVVKGGAETLLLVEDDDQLRVLACGILRREGYLVLEARSGTEATRLSDQHPGTIHLLHTDVVMPGMNGRELAEALAKSRPQIGVLFMSGYTDDVVLRSGIDHQRVAFLSKPFTPEQLTASLRMALDAQARGP